MRLTDVFTPRAIAARWTQDPSNQKPSLGQGLFPAKKKVGIDLKWIKGHKGLPISLAPSNFDAKATLMDREGFSFAQNEMAFFRAAKLIKERDEQEIMRIQGSDDPYLDEVLDRLFDDAASLIDGAEVVAERMRMQLLCPSTDGSPRIVIAANGVQYSYNYDPDGSYKTNNYKAMSAATDKWTDHTNSDPLGDLTAAQEAVEENTGVRPTRMLISRATFNHLKANAAVKSAILAQNVTANVMMNDARVSEVLRTELGLEPLICTKQYRDESLTAKKYYEDGFVTLLPDGALGSTWYSMTPEERALQGSGAASVSIVNTGVALTVATSVNPVNTQIIASEVLLPSYERMDETYVLKVY